MSSQPPTPGSPDSPDEPRTASEGAASDSPTPASAESTATGVAEPEPRKHGKCKRVLKGTALVFALPIAAVIGGLGYVAFETLTNRPDSPEEHEEAKRDYLAAISREETSGATENPNVVIVYYDDLGYGDLGFTGEGPIETPNIDELAANGMVLSNYHAPSPVCTPSRAAMLTGRLAPRAGVSSVLFPSDEATGLLNKVMGDFGLTQSELTIPDVLQASGYTTGMVGKWHIGDTEGSVPNDFGFDQFLGALYSNDINPFEIYENDEVIIPEPVDQTMLDDLYTDAAVDFISTSAESDDPFFLYFAHNFPHEPLFVSEENEGRSDAGLYGDVVEALDDGIGRIVDELEAAGELDNTVIMLTSDNGPWHEGDPGDHRGRKGDIGEGGTRVPFVAHWPEGIEPGQESDAMAMGTDILPTLLDWLDLPEPDDRIIDGVSMAPLLAGEAEKVGDYYYFYSGKQLLAVSDGQYKYYPRQAYVQPLSGSSFGAPSKQGPWLFDLSIDQSESYNLTMQFPEIAEELEAELERRDAEMEENTRGWVTVAGS
ncbi:sulfatase family protein [Demequina flava]|uniref:sulfatase family protein n=1 Tax=Demequina flava TaxID=1095025 RepID=UPI0007865C4F|nr:sulfatase [Demequina flava]